MLTVVAILRAQPGKEAALSEVMTTLAAEVKHEPGNRRYDLFRSMADPTAILVYEEYVDQAALDAHAASAHFKAASAEMRSLLAGRAEIHRYQELQ